MSRYDDHDVDDMDADTPIDPATEAALTELDRIGRHAALALRSAVGATTTLAPPAGVTSSSGTPSRNGATPPAEPGVEPGGDGGTPIVVDLRPARGEGRRRTRRRTLVLAAAAVAVVAGVAVTLGDAPTEPVQVAPRQEGAPTAVIGDEDGGIYPPEVTDRGLDVASPEHTQVWDQWQLSVPPAGHHLLLRLDAGDTGAVEVLPDLGSAALQAASVDSDVYVEGSGETAVFGVVDAAVDGTGVSAVTVERPGAGAVELHIEVLAGATHNAFVGFVPGDLGPGAEVVAVDPAGAAVMRAEVTPAGVEDPADGLYPDHPKAPTVAFGPEEPGDADWSGMATAGGHYVTIGAHGLEDSASTVVERPGTQPLQVLATHLNGTGEAVAVYGLVTTGAASVELQVPGHDPLALALVPIDGATHQAFGGWPLDEGLTTDDLDGAVVVARDAGGAEIGRRPPEWTRYDTVPG